VPIDHGYILPSCRHLEEVNVCWLYWPQARRAYDEWTLRYIEGLDAEADVSLLRTTLGLPEDCLVTLFMGTTLVQRAAKAGLTLHATGLLMVREDESTPSEMEEALSLALGECGLSLEGGVTDEEWRSEALREALAAAIEAKVLEAAQGQRVSETYRSLAEALNGSS
jgi:hypothetical protein